MPDSALSPEDEVLEGIWSSLAVGTAADSTGFSLGTQTCYGPTVTGHLHQTDHGGRDIGKIFQDACSSNYALQKEEEFRQACAKSSGLCAKMTLKSAGWHMDQLRDKV